MCLLTLLILFRFPFCLALSSVDARATLIADAEWNSLELQAPARHGSKYAGLFGQDYLITMHVRPVRLL